MGGHKLKKCPKSSRLSKILEMYPTYHQSYILHTHGLSTEGNKDDVKKCKRLTILPISKYSYSFSFIFVQIFSNWSRCYIPIFIWSKDSMGGFDWTSSFRTHNTALDIWVPGQFQKCGREGRQGQHLSIKIVIWILPSIWWWPVLTILYLFWRHPNRKCFLGEGGGLKVGLLLSLPTVITWKLEPFWCLKRSWDLLASFLHRYFFTLRRLLKSGSKFFLQELLSSLNGSDNYGGEVVLIGHALKSAGKGVQFQVCLDLPKFISLQPHWVLKFDQSHLFWFWRLNNLQHAGSCSRFARHVESSSSRPAEQAAGKRCLSCSINFQWTITSMLSF